MHLRHILALLAALLAVAAPALADPLLSLGADGARVSVSGLSSGGFMAVQYDVAFSGSTIGAGVIAGGPYGCADIYLFLFLKVCMQGSPEAKTSMESVRYFARNGMIDPAAGLARQRIYLFSGTKDAVVAPSVMNALRDFYRAARVRSTHLSYISKVPAGHAFISVETGDADCGANGNHYIDRCTVDGRPYDQPQAILSHIYGTLKPKAVTLSSAPIAFDQTQFTSFAARMAETGYVYIPAACNIAASDCAVHVVFHGCGQSAKAIGDDVYGRVGYNGWADSNRIIMLYPQVDASLPNPNGCWDWWGYSGTSFLFRTGPQLSAVHAMVAQLLTKPRPVAQP